jgi:carbon-monoxide dehydrogenase medium subunit
MKSLWESLHQPSSLEEALVLIRRYGSAARIIAGGTDVIVEMSRGVKLASTVIDISRVAELDFINVLDDRIVLGALATHNDVISDANCVSGAFPLVQAGVEIGAPQLRTRATVAGNIATASPANDTISALISLDASVSLRNLEGCRSVPIEHFITGFRRIDLEPDELIESISIPRLQPNQRGLFRKLGLRQAQAISVVHFAIVLSFDAEVVTSARIALGCVAPTVIRAASAEQFLIGKSLSSEVLDEASRLAASEATPIDDVRGSGEYRSLVLKRMLGDALEQLRERAERDSWQVHPVLLDSGAGKPDPVMPFAGSISTQLNGRDVTLSPESTRGTLLNAVRDELSLTGSKEGCAEGECGACTMWLDGQAVMSCLVPAAQAHGREVVTIEGLAESSGQAVHPLQASFVERAAIQCGFCIPGMVMAGAKLLEERPLPTRDDLKTALSGNICRCTGYTKIIDAMNQAAGHDH